MLIIVVFYFILIRPQRKRDKADESMRNNLEVGDVVTTRGGIVGKITNIKDDQLTLQTGSDSVKIRVMRWAVARRKKRFPIKRIHKGIPREYILSNIFRGDFDLTRDSLNEKTGIMTILPAMLIFTVIGMIVTLLAAFLLAVLISKGIVPESAKTSPRSAVCPAPSLQACSPQNARDAAYSPWDCCPAGGVSRPFAPHQRTLPAGT